MYKKQNRNWYWMVIGLGLLLALAACGGAPKVEWTLEISGAVDTPLTLDYATLVQLEQVDLTDVLMQKSLGEDEVASWSGPAVDELFKKAGVGEYSTITATAADGYAIDITRDELQGAIIALKKDDKWITEAEPDKGPIRLVCPQTPANRWVFQIQKIQVNP
ncbi:MAG TPA: molybdopterin-dependent oxidoreductase [Anaerolineae bacterium]|nr:molybdopterin-dependent oxidoreductase [Anaerolineae bacterium]HQH39711.1 molybdopterin-dependent oxidoreductase [Anaerolineae bacterium]